MKKSEIRTLFIERRQSLSPTEIDKYNQKIADLFFESVNLDAVRFMHCFIGIERFREIDSSIILHRIWAEHQRIQTVVPRINFETGDMESVAVSPGTKFIRNRWGVDEPIGSDVIESSLIDLVLVPLLAFDLRGHRVGYGKGFYDRFLKTCRPDCVKVGLSLFPPVDPIEDVFDQDVILDSVVTLDRIYHIEPAAY